MVPGEVLFRIRVLNIEPNDIVRKVKFLKLGVNCLDICLIPVVPPTLMIAKRKGRRKPERCLSFPRTARTAMTEHWGQASGKDPQGLPPIIQCVRLP